MRRVVVTGIGLITKLKGSILAGIIPIIAMTANAFAEAVAKIFIKMLWGY